MTSFDGAQYWWEEDPDNGEYELQFDRFESNKAVLLVVDEAEEWPIGDIVLPAASVPELDPDDAVGTAVFHGTIEDGELIEIAYDSALTEQRITEAEEQDKRIRANSADKSAESDKPENQ
ncbi:hypothetical protein [Halocatena salina]|uniref:DUF3006 domain-containing protein n=1 Tax=Halocatena salina TaxID=2934340 RepID=A0A8U0A6Y4_9EURY|nr:hypothetical protein [Halocatena salina]UPM43723.1 hypothetical protein MW046_04560 [Halocatena salina]